MTTTSLAATDDLRHRVPAGAKGRDSLFWNLVLPEEELGLQVYTMVDHNGWAGRQLAVFGPDAEPIALEIEHGIRMPGDADFDDWRVGPLEVRLPEPLRRAEVRYRSEAVSLEYDFVGLHEPFSYSRNPVGCPPWMAIDRFEQTGRATGVLRVAGRTIEFDALVHRDHSWGRRNWRFPHHWKWLCAQAPSGRGLNAMLWIARGELGVNGYVLRDGEPVALTGARQRAEYDDDMTQRHLEVELDDERGGTTTLTLERYGLVTMPFGSDTTVTEAACRATIDGEDGAGQWECLWPTSYLQHLVGSE
ncbi:DUF7064 domain-containing protein [Patulibacter sp. S7RM1-6]